MNIDLTATDGHSLTAWVDGPANAKHALVLVQEIFGVNHHMKNLAAMFAAQGYRVVVPALFDRVARGVELGYTPDDVARGRTLRAAVPEAGTLADIAAAKAHLPPAVPHGIVGYCWGGTVAWWGATRMTGFKAAVGYYGGGIVVTKDAVPNCPVQLHFGDQDTSIPMKDVEAIQKAQPGIEIFVYEGAGHGFSCNERGSYVKADARVAEARTLGFLAKHLA
ncbi:dienelactone hydrolase family protein [Humitalea sp. 24SJ18S-53]|uniref:dienelactone hydrolase family protein n=1 Tax=Humitalea sp. 24SJ18S-53 TaxID=3422307 RepID=UPI003D680094